MKGLIATQKFLNWSSTIVKLTEFKKLRFITSSIRKSTELLWFSPSVYPPNPPPPSPPVGFRHNVPRSGQSRVQGVPEETPRQGSEGLWRTLGALAGKP